MNVRNNIGGDIPTDVPSNQNIGGDVSPASPVGLMPMPVALGLGSPREELYRPLPFTFIRWITDYYHTISNIGDMSMRYDKTKWRHWYSRYTQTTVV